MTALRVKKAKMAATAEAAVCAEDKEKEHAEFLYAEIERLPSRICAMSQRREYFQGCRRKLAAKDVGFRNDFVAQKPK